MVEVISVSAFRCRMWSLHERLDSEITDESCKEEIRSFTEHGQLVAVLGRRLRNDPDHDIELIYGARRLFVARHLNLPLRVEVRAMSDREALIAMHLENHQRKELSPYERGSSYAHWLRTGQFQSQEEIAKALDISASQVSRLLRLARLPAVVVNAFGTPVAIQENWGLALMDVLDDEARREAMIRTARALAKATPRPAAREVFQRLQGAPQSGSRRRRSMAQDKVIVGRTGAPLFRIRYQFGAIALIVPTGALSKASLAQIELNLTSILQHTEGALVETSPAVPACARSNMPHEQSPGVLLPQAARAHRITPVHQPSSCN